MFLTNPATYLSVAQFQAQPNDIDLTPYTSVQLQDLLVRASGSADSYMRRSYLPQEITEQFEGDGTNSLDLGQRPLIYVKTAQLVMPGFAPFALPLGQLMVDYERGTIRSWSPMIFQSLGVANVFPKNGLPIVITYAYGFGYPIPPPAWSMVAYGTGTIPAGTYNLAVSTRTQPGESLPSAPQAITLTGGGITVNITPQPGAYVYRIYGSQGANTTLSVAEAAGVSTFTPTSMTGVAPGNTLTLGFGTADAENVTVASVTSTTFTTTKPSVNAHAVGETIVAAMTLLAESPATNYGSAILTVNVTSLAAPTIGALPAPLADTSAWPMPAGILEAVRLLALSMLYEQNNLANRGVYMTRTDRKMISWKSTEGTSGRGAPLMTVQAQAILARYSLQAIF